MTANEKETLRTLASIVLQCAYAHNPTILHTVATELKRLADNSSVDREK